MGADVLDAMLVTLPDAKAAFKDGQDGKFLASLSTLALQALAQVGVDAADVVDAKRSTYANDELFYSYRRDGVTGRHAAMIWMKE
ncbi:MAG: laccase domain-containing protein [Burkholderiaceae bacterium]|nr:laccase domain-containing protein [Burkholderiaceae bacterium]